MTEANSVTYHPYIINVDEVSHCSNDVIEQLGPKKDLGPIIKTLTFDNNNVDMTRVDCGMNFMAVHVMHVGRALYARRESLC